MIALMERYLTGQCDFSAFIVPFTLALMENGFEPWVAEAELLIAEFTGGYSTEGELKARLQPLVPWDRTLTLPAWVSTVGVA